MAYNLKDIKQKFKDKGVFYTPPELVKTLYDYVGEHTYNNVYDPTCGDGALLAFVDDNVKKYGQEIDAEQANVARSNLTNAEIVTGDTLENPAFMDNKFDLIVANPPFSIKWNRDSKDKDARFSDAPTVPTNGKADYAFILHCLHLLADDGLCVILNFPGIAYRGAREGKIRQWIVENNWVERVVNIPCDTFVDTKIATLLLVLSKNKTTTEVVFEDKELDLERAVTLDEIADNDYNLSVNLYVEKPIVKEHIDPVKLQSQARSAFMKKLEKELHFDYMVCQIEKWDHKEFVIQIQQYLNNYINKLEANNG